MTLIHIAFAKIYDYKGLVFEWHDFVGPTPLRRKDHEMLSTSSMGNRRWRLLSAFSALSDKEKEQYRI